MNSIKQIEVLLADRLVGRLALTKEGLCAFEYAPDWLGSGFSISPFELPLRSGVFIAKPRPFEGGFGVFDDCLPDGWGLLIVDRYLQQKGINPRALTLLDRLALVGSSGRGALEFRPDHSVVTRQDYADFEKLALEAERILGSDEYRGKGIEEFQDRGGSPGGARPKIFARYEGKEWLVKFRAKRDPQSIGVDEYRFRCLLKSAESKCLIHGFSKASTSAWSVSTERFKVSCMLLAWLVLSVPIIGCPVSTTSIFFKCAPC